MKLDKIRVMESMTHWQQNHKIRPLIDSLKSVLFEISSQQRIYSSMACALQCECTGTKPKLAQCSNLKNWALSCEATVKSIYIHHIHDPYFQV